MIKIIAKGYKYLLTQIDDFLGSARTIVISLKSVKGRKEYEQLFGRKLDDQKTNIIIRIHTSSVKAQNIFPDSEILLIICILLLL